MILMSKKANNFRSRKILAKNFFILTKSFTKVLYKILGLPKDPSFSLKVLYLFIMVIFFIWIYVFLFVGDILLLLFLPGLHLFNVLFKAGWKYGLITAIGVTLGVSIITQYVLFIYSYQFQAFNLYLQDEPRTYVQLEIENTLVEPSFNQYNILNYTTFYREIKQYPILNRSCSGISIIDFSPLSGIRNDNCE